MKAGHHFHQTDSGLSINPMRMDIGKFTFALIPKSQKAIGKYLKKVASIRDGEKMEYIIPMETR